MIKVENRAKIEKSHRKPLDTALKQVEKRIQNINENIEMMPNSDYLIHERYHINGQFFFTYKTKTYDVQLRLLFWFDQKSNSLILITYIIKNKTHQKYYNDLEDYAHLFYNQYIK